MRALPARHQLELQRKSRHRRLSLYSPHPPPPDAPLAEPIRRTIRRHRQHRGRPGPAARTPFLHPLPPARSRTAGAADLRTGGGFHRGAAAPVPCSGDRPRVPHGRLRPVPHRAPRRSAYAGTAGRGLRYRLRRAGDACHAGGRHRHRVDADVQHRLGGTAAAAPARPGRRDRRRAGGHRRVRVVRR